METFEIITTVINAVMMLTAVVTFVVSAWQYRNQQKKSFFEKYTARYQYLMEHMPEDFFLPYNESLPIETQKEIYHFILLYLDLCSEEYYLSTEGSIDKKVWQEWKQGIVYSFNNDYLKAYWKDQDKEYYRSYSSFIKFVNEDILK